MRVTLRSNSYRLVAVAAGLVGLLALATQGQNTSDQKLDQGSNEMLKSADMAFAMTAAQAGVAEIQMAKLAAEKANNADVKAFGRHMVTDHTKANENLKSVAEKKRMTLPTDMNAHQHATYRKLEKLSGSAFDRAYTKDMVKDHQQDAKEFQKEVKKGKDEDIKGFASRTLPVLREHLEKIRSIESELKQSGSSTK
jgi:putative membrane protein